MKEIDINTWNRKEHFEFFSKMVSPFFGLTTEVDCSIAYERAKQRKISFFAYYLHCSMKAVNEVEAFKYRIEEGKVMIYDTINAGAAISREDNTFAFIYVHFSSDFEVFNNALQDEIEEVKQSTGLRLNGDNVKKDLIRHSTIPWTSFSAILHPTNLDKKDSVPKITFGKFSEKEGKKFLPVSVEAHHGLMDGWNIAQYLEKFQELLNA